MNKNKKLTADQITHYFKGAATFSIKEKLYWYRLTLEALLLANEQEKSKDGKRFKYNFGEHKVIIEAIEALLHAQSPTGVEGISRDYSCGMIPLLKTHCQLLRNAVTDQVEKTMQEYLSNTAAVEEEKTFWDNPIASHAEILQGIRALPAAEVPGLMSTRKAVYTKACEQLFKSCDSLEKEVTTGAVSSIRAAWLGELLLMHSEAIVYVYGAWHFSRILSDLSLKDFRYNGQDIGKPEAEKDQKMLSELMLLSGKRAEQDSTQVETETDDHETCCCSANHDEHECSL